MISIISQSISCRQDDRKYFAVFVYVYRKVAVMFVSSYRLQSNQRFSSEEATVDLRQTRVSLRGLLYRLLIVRVKLHKVV